MPRKLAYLSAVALGGLLVAGCSTSQIKPNAMADDSDTTVAKATDDAVKQAGSPAEKSAEKVVASAPKVKSAVKKSRARPRRKPALMEKPKVAVVDTIAVALALQEKEKADNAKRRTSTLMLLSIGVIGVPLVGFAAFKIFGLGAASGGPPAGPPRAPPQA